MIEGNRIPNNEIFQYLFNDGNYNDIKLIEDWKEDEELKTNRMNNLNDQQRKAFQLCVDNNPLAFVQGPPGTGKTHLITKVVDYYTKLGMRTLISSQTNVAVENVLKNLWEDDEFQYIAIKAESNNKSEYAPINMSKLISNKIKRISGIDEMIGDFNVNTFFGPNDFNVVGSTTTSSTLETRVWSEWRGNIDVLIIDEISKSSVPELIRYSLMAKKIIFIGDQKQLPPLDEIDEDNLKKYNERDRELINKYILASIFANKYDDMFLKGRSVMLQENYRSLPIICNLYSKFYGNQLIAMRSEETTIKFKKANTFKAFNFIAPNGSKEAKDGTSRYNLGEIDVIEEVVETLVSELDDSKKYSVAIISQYGAQVKRMKQSNISKYKKEFNRFKINTIDAFQGDQADIVILSTVLADAKASTGFLEDYRRINVAISRAKDMLFMIGNDGILKGVNSGASGEKKQDYFNQFIKTARRDENATFTIYKGEK